MNKDITKDEHLPSESTTVQSAHLALSGETKGWKRLLPFLGPAFIASVAYIDPGNFATNIAAGSQYGYLLLWVILASNLMAVLIQTLSAKLGIATGNNLPEIARENFPKPVSIGLWIQGELVIMATDLAVDMASTTLFNTLTSYDITVGTSTIHIDPSKIEIKATSILTKKV